MYQENHWHPPPPPKYIYAAVVSLPTTLWGETVELEGAWDSPQLWPGLWLIALATIHKTLFKGGNRYIVSNSKQFIINQLIYIISQNDLCVLFKSFLTMWFWMFQSMGPEVSWHARSQEESVWVWGSVPVLGEGWWSVAGLHCLAYGAWSLANLVEGGGKVWVWEPWVYFWLLRCETVGEGVNIVSGRSHAQRSSPGVNAGWICLWMDLFIAASRFYPWELVLPRGAAQRLDLIWWVSPGSPQCTDHGPFGPFLSEFVVQ